MRIHQRFLFCLLLSPLIATASHVEFFASNNKGEIDSATAYQRLVGHEQDQLQAAMMSTLQQHHARQGKYRDVLGAYQMQTTHNITADNTENFETSAHQQLSTTQAIAIAKQLSQQLDQESVAIFVADKHAAIGKVELKFLSERPTIKSVEKQLTEKLPAQYSQAFSLILENESATFDDAKVVAVEWLGASNHADDIRAAFPLEKVSATNGVAYLVYQNGNVTPLS